MARQGGTRRATAAAVLALLFAGPGQAMTFAQAFEAARAYDAAYTAAAHERDVTQGGVPIARASLLPSVTFSAAESSVQGTRQFANFQNQDVRTRLDYDAPQSSLSLRMPLLNYEALTSYRQAQVQSDVADAVYRMQGMDLIDRLATAYLQVLLARAALDLAQAQTQTLQTQLAQATQRESRGEGTRVQVAQYQAGLDVARTRVIEGQDQLDLAQRQLTRLTGQPSLNLSTLPEQFTPPPLVPQTLEEWIVLAFNSSPSLSARQLSVEVARQGVKRQQAGHFPRLDLVGSVSRSQNDTSSTVGQSTNLRSVGVQLTVPLFSGGSVEASIKQASSRQAQAEQDLRNEREAIEVDIQRHFRNVANGAAKVAAYQRAVESTSLALQGARRSQQLGLGTVSDVAEMQTQLYTSSRDLAQARIDLLLSRVRLLARAGFPMSEVAADLDRLLAPAQAAAPVAEVQPPAAAQAAATLTSAQR